MDTAEGKVLSDAKRQLLKRRLSGSGRSPGTDEQVKPRPRGARIPISAEQQRIWFHSSTAPQMPVYNEAITIHRRGSFDRNVFNATFQEILRRHEAWRTSFTLIGDDLVQVVNPTPLVDLPFTDLSGLSQQDREEEALRLATADAAQALPLDGAALFRGRVLRFSSEEHRVQLTLHHIIFDGVSIYRIFMTELGTIYAALSAGQPVPYADPELQYGDYAIWREQHLTSKTVERHLNFWKQQLAGELPVLSLPVDHPRPAQISYRGSMECFQLSGRLVAALRVFSSAHRVTLYMSLLAAFKTLLFRYSGQQDIIVGGATDARIRPELEPLMGYFLNTFAIRTRPTALTPFTEFLAEVRDSVLDALSAADVPFDRVVRAVQQQRDGHHHPIFQVFFSIEPPLEPFMEGWDLTQMDVVTGSAKFDLYLELDERPDHMAARFIYNTDIFEAATIRRMADHWIVLLEGICEAPGRNLGTLPLLTAGELEIMSGAGEWNRTDQAIPQGTLHHAIEMQARDTPSAIAAVCGKVQWTYAGLMARVDSLALALQSRGAARGSIVAVLLTRSLDLLAGLLAILRTGAAYLPLDPATPLAGLALSLQDAAPIVVLTEKALLPLLPVLDACILTTEEVAHQADATLEVTNQPGLDDLAYVIHTSGSTGRPKAVEIRHVSLLNALRSFAREPGFSADDTLLAVTTVSFDIAALELFLPLLMGGRVVIADRQTAQDPTLLTAAIESSGCTVLQATPATWRALLASGWSGSTAQRPLRAICGGETLSRDLADRLLALPVELWNMYGPTETTIWSTCSRVTHGSGPVSIGKPIANTTAYLLDERQQFVPVGVPGHLYLGGVGLARGYRGRPDLTTERFVSPESTGGSRLYYTGDLAIRRPDGTLECLGRTDNQVKVRGFRIELEAVEAAISRHPRVEAAAAKVWSDPVGGVRLTVYVVGRGGPPPDLADLRLFLKNEVPEYMIPSYVTPLQAIPLTSNGKTDRGALPPPSFAGVTRTSGDPTTETERKLVSLWAEVLQEDGISVHDNFFDLGGHSLLVAVLQRKINLAFSSSLSMAALFHAPTVQQQAELIEASLLDSTLPQGLIPLQPHGSGSALFWLHPPPAIRALAAVVGASRPVFGLTLTEIDLQAMGPSPEIAEIARRHVATILHAQRQGPYIVGGFCTGGIVAFETAAQLQRGGHEVALLVLLDAQNPSFYRAVDSLAVELSKLSFYVRQARSGVSTNKTLQQRVLSRLRKILQAQPELTEMDACQRSAETAAYRYTPPTYSGDVLLLRPVDRPSRVDFLPGWQATVTGKLIAKNIAGHHEDLFNPDAARQIAQEIATVLGDASTLASN